MDKLPGFRDFFPHPLPTDKDWSIGLRNHILDAWKRTSRLYGFQEYDGPPLEPLELYTAKSGDEIMGQLYCFTDKGGRDVALRPEMTPTVARMIATHARNYKKPVKWFSTPQLFRYERQQKGRLREHFQWNADIFGESDPSADAELIALLIDGLRALGLTAEDFKIRLSSRGAWQSFFEERGAEKDNAYAFFQIVDKMEREPDESTREKLNALGIAMEDVESFLKNAEPTGELSRIVENLSARGLGDYVRVDYSIIRGLAYYTGPVFEAFDCKGDFRAIAGGGRYDNLTSLLTGGKSNIPALGFGLGDVVLAELLKSRHLLPDPEAAADVFVLIEDEAQRSASMALIQKARDRGLKTDFSLTPANPGKQFKRALELGARFILKLPPEAEPGGRVVFKNLHTREETTLTVAELFDSKSPIMDNARA